MAELPFTVSFRVTPEVRAWLQELADDNHRKLGEVVRLLLEEIYQKESLHHG